MPRGRPVRGRGGKTKISTRKKIVIKPPQAAKAWNESNQKEALRKLLALLQPIKSPTLETKTATVEYYYVSDIIPFLVSRIGKLATKPSTKGQLHDAIKKLLNEDPQAASAPPVDAVYLFCKLLSEGLISLSIKQEVSYHYPAISSPKELAVPPQAEEWNSKVKTRMSREEAKTTLKKIDQQVASLLKTSWRNKQLHWKNAQQNYFVKFQNDLEDTQKYTKLKPHYERVKQWIQKILEKKKEQHTPPKESNNNNNNNEENEEEDSVLAVEFHTHSTSWNFLHTLIKLFRVKRTVDDKFVDELIQAMVEDGMLKIEDEGQLKYMNKPPQKAPSVPPIAPKITCLFASTPAEFWEHNRVQIGRNNVVNTQNLATLLKIVGNPDTSITTKASASAPAPSTTAPKDATRKEGNIFAALAEEIDVATGKAPNEPVHEVPSKPVAPAPVVKESKKPEKAESSEFTSVTSKKKKGKKESDSKPVEPATTTSKTATPVATTASYAALVVEEEKDKEAQPKKKMSSKKKKAAAAAEAQAKTSAPETKAAPEPAKEVPKSAPAKANPSETKSGKNASKEEPKPATKASNPPSKATKEAANKTAPAKNELAKDAPKGKGAAPAKQQSNDNNKSKKDASTSKPQEPKQDTKQESQQDSNKKKKEKPARSQAVQVKQPRPPQKRKQQPPLVPPALILSCLFVFILIILAYVFRIDQFLDTLFD